MILDVGCRQIPKGDINTDLFFEYKNEKVDLKTTNNFIISDGHYLPFKDNAFDIVYCSHVLEHIQNPYKFFNELFRVSNYKIILKVPYIVSELWAILFRSKSASDRNIHRWFFAKYHFKYCESVRITAYRQNHISVFKGRYKIPLPFKIPMELTIIYKKQLDDN